MDLYLKDRLEYMGAKTENGQDLAEYAVFIGLIALVVLVAITILGTNISQIFTILATTVESWL